MNIRKVTTGRNPILKAMQFNFQRDDFNEAVAPATIYATDEGVYFLKDEISGEPLIWASEWGFTNQLPEWVMEEIAEYLLVKEIDNEKTCPKCKRNSKLQLTAEPHNLVSCYCRNCLTRGAPAQTWEKAYQNFSRAHAEKEGGSQ